MGRSISEVAVVLLLAAATGCRGDRIAEGPAPPEAAAPHVGGTGGIDADAASQHEEDAPAPEVLAWGCRFAIPEEARRCRSHEDCVMFPGPCSGSSGPGHRRYAEQAGKRARECGPLYQCISPRHRSPTYLLEQPVCVDDHCESLQHCSPSVVDGHRNEECLRRLENLRTTCESDERFLKAWIQVEGRPGGVCRITPRPAEAPSAPTGSPDGGGSEDRYRCSSDGDCVNTCLGAINRQYSDAHRDEVSRCRDGCVHPRRMGPPRCLDGGCVAFYSGGGRSDSCTRRGD